MQVIQLNQSVLAVWSLVIGAVLCAFYDILRAFRLGRRTRALTLFVSDFAFCLISALLMLVMFYNLTFGRIRAYAFVFMLVGFLIWRFTVGKVFISIVWRIIIFLQRILSSVKTRIFAVWRIIARYIHTKNYCRVYIKRIKRGTDSFK